jgi:hypothetical protein
MKSTVRAASTAPKLADTHQTNARKPPNAHSAETVLPVVDVRPSVDSEPTKGGDRRKQGRRRKRRCIG